MMCEPELITYRFLSVGKGLKWLGGTSPIRPKAVMGDGLHER